ncbi:EscU/YscU/HrcU family type III secretion system export apparatus switch protein [Paraburkholderia acidicola]|nr:EscU/YscU/HrcU family type III secretion system export apparatus switch protein [Paraburkholderia acidicola]
MGRDIQRVGDAPPHGAGGVMAEQDLDRNEAATPYKLQQARKRGQVSKSPDVVSAVVFTTAMLFLASQGWTVWQAQFRIDRVLLSQAGQLTSSTALGDLVGRLLLSTMTMALPFLITLMLAAIVGNLMQTGLIFSADPIKPDWSRINPVSGFKKLFTLRVLFNGVRACLKLGLLSAVAWFALKSVLPQFYYLAGLSALGILRTLLDDFASLGLKMALMLGFVALLDMLYTRREFAKNMRMSKRELKDEFRQREGDPRIRSRLRELRREMLKRSRAVQNTQHADVLITNPTHVAVALRYVHGQMESPQLVAKGAGVLAAAMRKVAARHNIPVVQNPPLARRLFHDLHVDQSVPPELYAQVARIIVWVFAMRDARRRGTASQQGAPA